MALNFPVKFCELEPIDRIGGVLAPKSLLLYSNSFIFEP